MEPSALNQPPPLPKRRPVWVWVISCFYAFSVFSTVVSYAVVFSGFFPTTQAQQQYFASLSFFDHALTAVVLLLNLSGAVALFRLKKQAPVFFSAAFALGLATVVYQWCAKDWFAAVGISGLIGAVIGWAISIAIIVYALRLRKEGVLS